MTATREFDKCSRCGLCLAVCPTYSRTLREQYGPRGRLTLMRLAESGGDRESALPYISSCLRCTLCEEVCPTGVPYGQLVRRFLNQVVPCREDEQIEALQLALRSQHSDPARLPVFTAMLQACRHLPFDPAAPPVVTEEHHVLLIAGDILTRHFPEIVSCATEFVERAGSCVLRSAAADAISLPWMENGMFETLRGILAHATKDIAKGKPDFILLLDPSLTVTLTHPLVRAEVKNWPESRSYFDQFDLQPQFDLASDTVAVDRTLPSSDVLYRAACLREPARSWPVTPAVLRGAGAPPVFDLNATRFLEGILESKQKWLQSLSTRLATIDPYTLLRLPGSFHAIQEKWI